MTPPRVWVYLRPKEKQTVADVAHALRMSESALVKQLAMPKVAAVQKALEQGMDAEKVKQKVFGKSAGE